MVHVPYKGSAPAYAAIMAGEIQVLVDGMPAPLPHLRSGKMRPLGVTGDKRLGVLPEVPSFAEQGVKGVDAQFWWGIVAPAGTPQRSSPGSTPRSPRCSTTRRSGRPREAEHRSLAGHSRSVRCAGRSRARALGGSRCEGRDQAGVSG